MKVKEPNSKVIYFILWRSCPYGISVCYIATASLNDKLSRIVVSSAARVNIDMYSKVRGAMYTKFSLLKVSNNFKFDQGYITKY
jgi:hypothetical protein